MNENNSREMYFAIPPPEIYEEVKNATRAIVGWEMSPNGWKVVCKFRH
jgi:hypothetical protein